MEYRCTAAPCCERDSPHVTYVTSPPTKSVCAALMASGFQRSRLGETSTSRHVAVRTRPSSICSNGPCIAEGRRRYSHERRLAERGAVKAEPESCSAYRPNGTFCGEFWPCG